MARAIIKNDLEKLEATIIRGENVDATMKELKNLTPGELAVSLGRIRCVLLLITKAGLDPWEGGHCEGNSIWVLTRQCRVAPLLELKDRLEPIALNAYPPVSASIFDRAWKIIRSF